MNRFAPIFLLVATAAVSGQSLWTTDRPLPSLFADTTARQVGDVLTIAVNERQTVKNKEETELKKGSDLNAAITNFNVMPGAFGTLPAASGIADRNFKGEAKYDKEGAFATRISVLVIDVQPNGNLVVEGRRRIVIDGETKTIRITGIVRPFDIPSNNTVSSDAVANASIAYEAEGTLNRATNRGWLGDLLDFAWPF